MKRFTVQCRHLHWLYKISSSRTAFFIFFIYIGYRLIFVLVTAAGAVSGSSGFTYLCSFDWGPNYSWFESETVVKLTLHYCSSVNVLPNRSQSRDWK